MRRRLGAHLRSLPAALLIAGCAGPSPEGVMLKPDEARARIASALPPQTPDRAGWATDFYAAFAALRLAPTPSNICAAVGVTEQESGFRADPTVPGLAKIARRQIDERADRAGVPSFVVAGALLIPSPDGRSFGQRIDAATTERELSDTFDDFIGLVPLGQRLFAGYNPVRTGGPMQVSVAYAEQHAKAKPYPYPVDRSIRREVFTRRGGVYFGIAHLLDYAAGYDEPIYRFADFNAGHYASRNAALQNAISIASGIPLVPDGDLLRHDAAADDEHPGATEAAARVLADRLDMSPRAIRADLAQGDEPALERTTLYRRVYALADRTQGQPLPRAALPQIELHSPKITRKLTTAWFARRVDERYRRCLGRVGSVDPSSSATGPSVSSALVAE